jgi:hypothetical protein
MTLKESPFSTRCERTEVVFVVSCGVTQRGGVARARLEKSVHVATTERRETRLGRAKECQRI